MVEILDPLERDVDHSRYWELCYNYVAHMEDSHTRFVDAWSCTCRVCALSSCWLPLSSHQSGDGMQLTWWAWCPIVSTWLECAQGHSILIWYNGLRDPKMYPHSFKEEFGSVLYCDTLLTYCQYNHLRKFVHDHKYTIITMFGRRESR